MLVYQRLISIWIIAPLRSDAIVATMHTLSDTIKASTLNSAYNKKKYAEILLHYRWLFIKNNVFIGERGLFGTEVFLHYRRFFIKSNFVIGRVECMYACCVFQFLMT